jgi:hypothetical protein
MSSFHKEGRRCGSGDDALVLRQSFHFRFPSKKRGKLNGWFSEKFGKKVSTENGLNIKWTDEKNRFHGKQFSESILIGNEQTRQEFFVWIGPFPIKIWLVD